MSQDTPNRRTVGQALTELCQNNEQYSAATARENCVVLAGPGSGKTKTLTTAMARTLLEDVAAPRGVACITYSNECAIELEDRLSKLGVYSNEQVYIGTVHSFTLAQIIAPYARCVLSELANGFRVASKAECDAAVADAFQNIFGGSGNPDNFWKAAQKKRRTQINRNLPEWNSANPDLARFIEAYEHELHSKGLIDYDDMPLIAYRMVRDNPWIIDALKAKFPVLFVDEYQDLGHALHELVLLLCFEGGIRLFAVGDADQSVYMFNDANPDLLLSLTSRSDVQTLQLRLNYRCGTKIIDASMAALGEDRNYSSPVAREKERSYLRV